MNPNLVALWLDELFENMDYAIFSFLYNLHEGIFGRFFDSIFSFITSFGNGGVAFIVLTISLITFNKTRKIGIAIAFSLIIGALLTNVLLKPLVERQRPYVNQNTVLYWWWKDVGYPAARDVYSFPSGHTTSAFAAIVPIFILTNKKYSFWALIFASLVGISRSYLFVHYPSDVFAGILIGVFAGIMGVALMKYAYKKREIKNISMSDFKSMKEKQ